MCALPRARLRVAHTCALRKPVFQQTGATAPKEAGNSPEEYARIHGEFMTMVHDLIDGSLESSAYEDHCRALLGECLTAGFVFVSFRLDSDSASCPDPCGTPHSCVPLSASLSW